MNHAEVIAGTKVKVVGVKAFREYELGVITKSGAFPDFETSFNPRHKPLKHKPQRFCAEVRMETGAYAGRSFSIGLPKLEVLEPVEDREG